ncbi:hypothetical protein [Methylomonas sp. MgM2]
MVVLVNIRFRGNLFGGQALKKSQAIEAKPFSGTGALIKADFILSVDVIMTNEKMPNRPKHGLEFKQDAAKLIFENGLLLTTDLAYPETRQD